MQLLGQPDSRGWREVSVRSNKSEYRISKSEANSKLVLRTPNPAGGAPVSNVSMFKTNNEGPASRFACFGHLDFGNSDLFRASCFGFGILIALVIEQRLFIFLQPRCLDLGLVGDLSAAGSVGQNNSCQCLNSFLKNVVDN